MQGIDSTTSQSTCVQGGVLQQICKVFSLFVHLKMAKREKIVKALFLCQSINVFLKYYFLGTLRVWYF